MPLTITNTLVNGNVVDAPQLNTNFGDVRDALDGTDNVDITIKNNHAANPPLILNETGAADIQKWQKNGADVLSIENSGQIKSVVVTGTPPIIVDSTDVCTNLNADRVDGIEGSNITKLDTHKTYHTTVIGFESDPTLTTLSIEDRAIWIAPANANEMKIIRLWIVYNAGSHTAGGNLQYTIRRRDSAGGSSSDLGTVTLDNTNNTIRTVYYNNIADFTLTSGDIITFYKATASGTITERSVSIGFEWYQKPST